MVVQSIKDFYQHNKNFLIDHYPGLSEKRLVDEFGSDTPEQLNQHLSKLSMGIPLEYITGKSYFYNSEYLVNESTLIPRFETEGLVELGKYIVKENDRVLDVGTGSGNIILSLVQEVSFPLIAKAVDISEKCVETAKMNGFRLRFKYHPKTIVDFKKQDRLIGETGKYNLIISNPPYIKRDADKSLVHHQVFKYEPHTALFLDDNEYDHWFDRFFSQVSKHLEADGVFLMEGHENHLAKLKNLAANYFKRIEIKNDLSGRERYFIAHKG